jgi:hypothetical protein
MCVHHDPIERPKNGSELLSELEKLGWQRIARQERPRNVVWLDLTRAATEQIVESSLEQASAAPKLQADLASEVFASFKFDHESGKRNRERVVIVGSERSYTLAVEASKPQLTVIAAKARDFEELEALRRRSLALPPIFSWTCNRPANLSAAVDAQNKLVEILDEFYERKEHPETEGVEQAGDELFDVWLRLLDAREDLARGEHQPLSYKKYRVDGRRTTFTLTEPTEVDLVGTDWEIVDRQSSRKFGHGEVIDQDSDTVTLLSRRQLTNLTLSATLVPYDAPSAVSLGRQRNALLNVKNRTAPGPDLREILIDPSSNTAPSDADVTTWSMTLDTSKKRAVELALGTHDVLVIQGPPGTGKTSFIAETVIQTLRRAPSARILIASQTHVAVDNAVERLHNAGVKGLVRLAGADDSAVQSSVRDLLLDRQIQLWAERVRSRAERHVIQQAEQLGISHRHLQAALVLEQLVAVTRDLERVRAHAAVLAESGSNPSDLHTAVADEDSAERYQARFDQLTDRRQELVAQAQQFLAGDLTVPTEISSIEARSAIDVLLGDSAPAMELLRRIELQASWLERIGLEDSLAGIYLAGTSVVAGTCTGFLRNKAVSQLEFDLCIVDEASKATLTEALVPMSRAKRWILVGDIRQLPPMDEDLLRSENLLHERGLTKDNVTETLFQRLVDYLPEHSQLTLDEQYRMVRPIGDLISTCFYEGKLRSPRTRGLDGYEKVAGKIVSWIDTSVLGDRRREQGVRSFANRAEAQLAMRELTTIDRALDHRLIKPESDERLDVLVIAPYKSQVEELRRRLAAQNYRHLAPSVMSVDAVQGREADLVIISVTRSNDEGKLGFLGADYWRRINVALSRARFGLTIIGDAGFIRGTNGALRNVIDYIEQHPTDCGLRAASLD